MHNQVQDPNLLILLPMVKASFQAMRAIEDFTSKKGMAEIESHVLIGASKRGWLAYLGGAVAEACTWCPKLSAIIPMVPIMPVMNQDIHR